MKIIALPAHGSPSVKEIDNTLEAIQSEVGGCFEVVTLHDGISIACNEEGRLIGLPNNEHIQGICGPCFLFSSEPDPEGEMCGLDEQQIELLMELLTK